MNAIEIILSGGSSKVRPPIPTREQVCGIGCNFQGGDLIQSSKYGLMPWYASALSWCDPATRSQVYLMMKNTKQTHCILEVPSGDPLYPEYGQFYNPDKFPALDWTNGLTDLTHSPFLALFDEIVYNGFRVLVEMDERVEYSQQVVQLVYQAFNSRQDYDRSQYCITFPGYDSVFYGWTPDQIMEWASLARALDDDCYLGMEFNPGHIPLGNGLADYQPGGNMSGFDTVAGEFLPDPNNPLPFPYGAISTQIVGRLVNPYIQDPNNPISPTTPFILVDSSRGPRYFWAMETGYPYGWARVDLSNPTAIQAMQADIASQRQYYADRGSKYNG